MSSFFVAADEILPEPISWLWPNRIPLRALSLVEGNPGEGKSSTLYDIAARVSSGREMPGSSEPVLPGGVLWISDEDSIATSRRNLEVAGAHLNRILIYDKRTVAADRLVLPSAILALESAIVETNARLVVIDPIASFIEGSASVEKCVRAALGPLAGVGEKTGAAIVLVRHLRKAGSKSPLFRGAGSIAMIAAARSALLVGTDPANKSGRVIAQFKSSLGTLAESLSFSLVSGGAGIQVSWLGRSNYSAEQVLAAATTTEVSALEEAEYVLFSILGNGRMLANDAKQAALQSGVAPRTLRRAKEVLGVVSKREGFGSRSRFYWRLPENNELVRRLRQAERDQFSGTPYGPQIPPRRRLLLRREPVAINN